MDAEKHWRKIIKVLEERFQDLTFLDDRDRSCPSEHVLGVLIDWNWKERRFIESGGMLELVERLQREQRPVLLLGYRGSDAVRTGRFSSLLEQRAVRYVALIGPLSEIGQAIRELRLLTKGVVAETSKKASRITIADEIDGVVHKLVHVKSFIESTLRDQYCQDAGNRQELLGWLQSTAKGMYETRSRLLDLAEGAEDSEVSEWVKTYMALVDRVSELSATCVDLRLAQCEKVGNDLRNLLAPLHTMIDSGYAIAKSIHYTPARGTKEVSRRRSKVAIEGLRE